jgi:uncharacterized protein YozE (UPF0346 family)
VPGDFLNIAGFDLAVTAGGGRREDTVRGEAVRAFANNLLDGTDAPKGAWDFPLASMTLEDAAAFRTAISSGPVECWGRRLLIPLEANAIMCKVRITREGDGPNVQSGKNDWTDVNVVLSISMEEV